MFSEGGQTRKHCFLAMFPEGDQNRNTEAGFLLQAFLSEELSHSLEEVRYRKINNATIVLQKHVSIIRILNKKIRSHILKI